MGIIYSAEETRDHLAKVIKNIEGLYKDECINWAGKTKGKENKEYYSEIIAKFLKEEGIKEKLSQIKPIGRKKYKLNHDGKTKRETNRREEIFAKKLVTTKRAFANLGEILGYQIPLKDKQKHKAGKIDLISYNENPKRAYIIELKFGYNKETLLRAVLEISTYYHQLSQENFLNSFDQYKNNGLKPKDIKKAVLLCEFTNSYNEAKDLKNRLELKKLIEELDVKIFLMNYNTEEIELI